MKKTLIVLAAIYMLVVALSYSTSAQGTNNVIAFTDNKAFTKSLQYLVLLDDSVIATTAADMSAINTKAVKDFNHRFGNATSERWFKIPDGFVSYFTLDGSKTRVLYDQKGHWLYTIKQYKEDKLPRDIRAIVKSTYYDYSITIVHEIQVYDNLVYVVLIEDQTSFKKLRITKDGEMDVLEEFFKG